MSLSAVLEWKYGHAAGVRTGMSENGEVIITAWPDALGARPMPEEIAVWTQQYHDRQAVFDQIRSLELTVTQRRMREAVTTEIGKTWMADIEATIAALRSQLT